MKNIIIFGVAVLGQVFLLPHEARTETVTFPPAYTFSGTAPNDAVGIQVSATNTFFPGADAYGVFDDYAYTNAEEVGLSFHLDIPVNSGSFQEDIPLFLGRNQVILYGSGETEELLIDCGQVPDGQLEFVLTWPHPEIGFSLDVWRDGRQYLENSGTEGGESRVLLTGEALKGGLFSITATPKDFHFPEHNHPSQLHPINYVSNCAGIGRPPDEVPLELKLFLDGEEIYSATNTIKINNRNTRTPSALMGVWHYIVPGIVAVESHYFGTVAVHAGGQSAAYSVDNVQLRPVPQAQFYETITNYLYDVAVSVAESTALDSSEPVYLATGDAAQFTLVNATNSTPLPSVWLLDVFEEGAPSAPPNGETALGRACITSTGVFLGQKPGHYQVGTREGFFWVPGFEHDQYIGNSTRIDVHVFDPPRLAADFDRDGDIDTNDFQRAENFEAFRFWVNDDNDDAADANGTGGEDLPGLDVDNGDSVVNTLRDLVDFFPVHLQIKDTLDLLDEAGANYEVRLSSNVELGVIDLVLSSGNELVAHDCMAYLTDVDTANEVAAGQVSRCEPSYEMILSPFFLDAIQNDPTQGILLVEAHQTNSNAELTVKVLVDGNSVSEESLQFSISSVEDMYRFHTLRGDGRVSDLDQPDNYPDYLTSGQDLVFVHGYNVDADSGDATHAEVFKRMFQSGFNGRFWGVSWYGDVPVSIGSGSHYHHSVVEMFSAAHGLRAFLSNDQLFTAPPDLAAHSLGNGVVGVALNDATNSTPLIRNYFALDAAMSLEAYGETNTISYMTYPHEIDVSEEADVSSDERTWDEYPETVWASEWHKLFAASDARSGLTWRNRMAGAVGRVGSAYNFYSSTEEVLRADADCSSFLASTPPPIGDGIGFYAWQVQEWYKGMKGDSFWLNLPDWVAGGSSDQCGWSFVTGIGVSQHRYQESVLLYTLRSPEWVNGQLATNSVVYLESLKSDPIFKQKPDILFSANGNDFVGDYVTAQAAHLDYTQNWLSNVLVRDWLLAKAFPARSRPMGSSPIAAGLGWEDHYNMASASAAENGLMLHDWPRDTDYNGLLEWFHGDYKDVAYPYVQELYKKWVELIESN